MGLKTNIELALSFMHEHGHAVRDTLLAAGVGALALLPGEDSRPVEAASLKPLAAATTSELTTTTTWLEPEVIPAPELSEVIDRLDEAGLQPIEDPEDVNNEAATFAKPADLGKDCAAQVFFEVSDGQDGHEAGASIVRAERLGPEKALQQSSNHSAEGLSMSALIHAEGLPAAGSEFTSPEEAANKAAEFVTLLCSQYRTPEERAADLQSQLAQP